MTKHIPRPARPARPRFTPVATRSRHDGWTPAKQVAFVEALAESACVDEAAKAVGMSRETAYRLRARVDAQTFRIAWDAALDFAVRRLSDAAFARAVNGEPVPHYYKGEVVGEHRRYDNRLTMFLLRYRDPLRYAATLDKMVYSGHPETAAIGFARARDRLEAQAFGDVTAIAEEAMAAAGPPHTHMIEAEAAAVAVAEAEAEAEAAEQARLAEDEDGSESPVRVMIRYLDRLAEDKAGGDVA